MYRNGHSTPFEKIVFEFKIKCPIFIARQWMRHRTGSYNELSARYSTLHPDFFYPMKNLHDMYSYPYEEFKKAYDVAYQTYESMLANNIRKEVARAVLPVGVYTEFYWRTDLHNLYHFLDLRASKHAQSEIQEYARAIINILKIDDSWKYLMNLWEEVHPNFKT